MSSLPEHSGQMQQRRFTLIELILVMAALATVMAVTAPALARFFRGRSVTEEARRLTALVRYARSQAISRSEPMEVWVEPADGSYGLRAVHEHETDGEANVRFDLPEEIGVDCESADPGAAIRIVYWPDGMADPESAESLDLHNLADSSEVIRISRPETSPWYTIEE